MDGRILRMELHSTKHDAPFRLLLGVVVRYLNITKKLVTLNDLVFYYLDINYSIYIANS